MVTYTLFSIFDSTTTHTHTKRSWKEGTHFLLRQLTSHLFNAMCLFASMWPWCELVCCKYVYVLSVHSTYIYIYFICISTLYSFLFHDKTTHFKCRLCAITQKVQFIHSSLSKRVNNDREWTKNKTTTTHRYKRSAVNHVRNYCMRNKRNTELVLMAFKNICFAFNVFHSGQSSQFLKLFDKITLSNTHTHRIALYFHWGGCIN